MRHILEWPRQLLDGHVLLCYRVIGGAVEETEHEERLDTMVMVMVMIQRYIGTVN